MGSPIIVALDGIEKKHALRVARLLKGLVWGFKVHDLYIREGPGMVRALKRYGKVFIDLKFHDIPQTVAHEVETLTNLGADLITVHAAGGREMCEAAVRAGGRRVVAVTVLTSGTKIEARRVPYLASVARAAGIENLVASPHEVTALKKLYPTATIITPGIRGPEDRVYDQRRTATPRAALERGATLLVIGRPITEHTDPRAALERLLAT